MTRYGDNPSGGTVAASRQPVPLATLAAGSQPLRRARY